MAVEVSDNIFWVGVNDHETRLFEALWPLPHGISYNAYLIRDRKNALIDAVKKDYGDSFIRQVRSAVPEGQTLDYLIINHMEPDHSGAIEALTALYPEMCIVGNEKTIDLLRGFYKISNKTLVIKDKETLALGDHTLEFYLTPMVHWPETMMTFERKTGTLFSGDAFGSYGALPEGIFDDEVDLDFFVGETRRYFSNIVGKYAAMVQKAIAKLAALPVKIVASTHGPVYRKNPRSILDLYDRWSRHENEKGVVVVYASMYGHTKKMADAVAGGLAENGVKEIKLFDISYTHLSFILSEIWRFRGVILGSCTYNTKLFPPMELLLSVLENSRLQNHLLGLFSGQSWSGGALEFLKKFAEKTGWKIIEPAVEVRCAPSGEDLERCRELGKNFALALQ